MEYKNVVGRQVARIRFQRDWTQADLARELQKLGWDISRSEVAKVEARSREVKDWQMMFFVRALGAEHECFYPWTDPKEPFRDVFPRLMEKKRSGYRC